MIDMIYRYVYFKTPWYADLDTQYYVEVSEHMLGDILENPAEYTMDILCLQLWNLSDGSLIVG